MIDQGKKEAAEEAANEKATAGAKAKALNKGVVQVRSLNIRKDHTNKSIGAGGLVAGQEVTIYETWAQVGENRGATAFYNGKTYIKIEA